MIATLTDLPALVGADLGRSKPRVISQHDIDQFAHVTGDHQWIHVDAERAASGPFGATVAHGFLTLSLVAPVLEELLQVEGVSGQLNYGLNRVRFPSPVLVGSELYGEARIREVEKKDAWTDAVLEVSLQDAGEPKPACIAEVLVRLFA